jgi:amino acid adenylation domain-containing protein
VTNPTELLDRFTRQGVALWAEGSRLRFRAPKGTMSDSMRAEVAEAKDLLLNAWRERAAQSVISLPATHGQQALWFLNQSNPGSAAYNVVFSARIRSEIDLPALHHSFQALVDRHSSLRTNFREESDHLVQRVTGYVPVSFTVHGRPDVDLETLRKEVHQASRAPFNLQKDPLLRVDLYERAANDRILLFTVHHIAADGWSLFLLLDDLRRIYPAERGTGLPPPRPLHDILEHSRWQDAMLAGPEGAAHEAYWLKKMSGELSPLSISTDHPRQLSTSDRGASFPINLGTELSEDVRALAAKEGATPFVVLLTAYQLLLHRYTGQQEVIVGSPTYGRDSADFADVVGDFINMIPLKAEFAGDPSFKELLAQGRQTVVEGIQHQDFPFPLLVKKVQPDRDSFRTPIFQTVFILQKFKQLAGLESFFTRTQEDVRVEFGELVLEPFPVEQQEGQFELSLELAEKDGAFQGIIKYDPELFDVSTIRLFANHYVNLIEAIVSTPDTQVSRLSLLSPTEREELTIGFNATESPYPGDRTVVDLIGEQVARRPNAKAISFEGTSLTYQELDSQSTRLAQYLQSIGVGPESLVCLFLKRGLEMVVGVLAVLKAGGAYVPLDPSFPVERLRYMIEDSRAKVLVTQTALSEMSFSDLDLVRVYLDDDKHQIDQAYGAPFQALAKPTDRAYVIYTSGSTGRPKGVEIEHRSLTNFLWSMAKVPGLNESDVLLAVTTLSFDIAGLELFLPLITGARLELASLETARDGVALVRTIATSGATVLQATPSTWRMLFEWGWKGDAKLKALCGGEAMDQDLAARLVSTCGQVWNMYGPTETTIWSSIAQIEFDEVTIGRPIANTRMYVLDQHFEPVPRGVAGELWIGGDGVARGYLNRPDLTAQRFVPDPFHEGERMYRTGDLARRLFDGRLECLGRLDSQVKIRGYRIELREIETALSSHASIRDCVVHAHKDNPDGLRLVAYAVLGGSHRPAVEDLRIYLQTILPDYMVPSAFVFIDAIPMTPNGKVDRDALPAPAAAMENLNTEYVPPRNHVERLLAEIWSEVLGVEQIGVFDHFFELGGHSLSATRLIAKVQLKFKIELPLRIIFIEPTIAGVSRHIYYDEVTKRYQYDSQVRRWNRLVPAQPMGSRIPFFLVAGFLDADDILRILSNLIPHLGLDQPVYGFQPRWFDGHSDRYASVEEAAAEFLAELRALQPNGPYLLGGDCTGGIVALAIAQELLRQGEEVRLLVLFDTTRPTALNALNLKFQLAVQRGKYVASLLGQLISGSLRSKILLLRDLCRRKFRRILPLQPTNETAADRIIRMSIDYIKTIYRYRAKNYPGRLTLIVNEELYASNKSMGWENFAQGGLEIHRTPGGHLTRYELYSKELANRLLECLERAQVAPIGCQSEPGVGAGNNKSKALLCASAILLNITSLFY